MFFHVFPEVDTGPRCHPLPRRGRVLRLAGGLHPAAPGAEHGRTQAGDGAHLAVIEYLGDIGDIMVEDIFPLTNH